MNEQRVADWIRRYLNLCTQRIDPRVAEGLRQARSQALAHYAESKPEWRLAPAGLEAGAPSRGSHSPAARVWIPLLVVLAVGIGVTSWHYFSEQGVEPGEVDALLLGDDLPVRAYLDHRFDAWLKRAQE